MPPTVELGHGAQADDREFPLQSRAGRTEREEVFDGTGLETLVRHHLDDLFGRDDAVGLDEDELLLHLPFALHGEVLGRDALVGPVVLPESDHVHERERVIHDDAEGRHAQHQLAHLPEVPQEELHELETDLVGIVPLDELLHLSSRDTVHRSPLSSVSQAYRVARDHSPETQLGPKDRNMAWDRFPALFKGSIKPLG